MAEMVQKLKAMRDALARLRGMPLPSDPEIGPCTLNIGLIEGGRAPNVIPGKVVLSLELRDLDAAKIQMLFQQLRTEAGKIAQTSKVTFDFKEINVNIPAPTDARIRSLIDQSAKELGLSTKQMPSGAGHDAQDMARLAPVGMIFIPSVGGISHSPKEFSRPQDITNGANV